MDKNKRPYLIYKIDSIRDLFYKNTSNRIVLRNIMHELKTPLAKCRISAEMLEDDKNKQRIIWKVILTIEEK